MLNFSFVAESTLNYTHSYSNVLKYVCKSYFPASSREVYMKEFLVTRVNTWFCKFSRLDTFVLYRGVYHKGGIVTGKHLGYLPGNYGRLAQTSTGRNRVPGLIKR